MSYGNIFIVVIHFEHMDLPKFHQWIEKKSPIRDIVAKWDF